MQPTVRVTNSSNKIRSGEFGARCSEQGISTRTRDSREDLRCNRLLESLLKKDELIESCLRKTGEA